MSQTQEFLGREVGVVDIGSNSVRLVIYDIFGAHFTPVYNEKILAGLGRSLKKTGRLSEEGKTLTLQALSRFTRIAKARGLPPLIFGATAALRVASDAKEFLNEIKNETGLDVVPISGDEEARLSAMGLISMHPRATGLAADLGGASLELVEIQKGDLEPSVGKRQSLPLGPFDLIGDDLTQMGEAQIEKAKIAIRTYLDEHKDLVSRGHGQTLYLIGGAWRNLAAIHQSYTDYPLRTLQSYKMAPQIAKKHAQWAYGNGRETVLKWPGMRRRRAETLPYSGVLLDVLLDAVKPASVMISQSGLREGLVHDAIPASQRQRDPLFDGCRAFAKGSLQTENYGRPLYGKDLHPDYRPEAIFAAVLYAPVAGLTHEERVFLALCLFRSNTSSRDVPSPDVIDMLLTRSQCEVARIIGSAIRLAIVATGQSSELLDAFTLSQKEGVLCLEVDPSEKALLTEQVRFRLKKLAQKLDMTYKMI